ncbi:MAG TPA: cytidine deaminase [Armatimonadota bacterium]|jgi:homotetrameric cytidine deaminase
MPPDIQELYDVALAARENSYSPYSGHKVGAAIRLSDGAVFSGCNVENASFGATVCAERTAVQTAVAARGAVSIVAVMVVTDSTPSWPPCGICRQVLAEFGPNCTVHSANLRGEIWTVPLSDLYPRPAGPDLLSR